MEFHLAAWLVRVEHLLVEVNLILKRVVLVLGREVDSLSHVLLGEVRSRRLARHAPPLFAEVSRVQGADQGHGQKRLRHAPSPRHGPPT